MSEVISLATESKRKRLGSCSLVICACATLALPMAAQRQGPLPPPPGTAVPSIAPAEPAKTNAPRQEGASRINTDAPAVPVQEIIQKFTEHEDEFRKERENYTYTQYVIMQTIDDDGQPDGEYRLTSDILFTPSAKRYEKVIEAPAS